MKRVSPICRQIIDGDPEFLGRRRSGRRTIAKGKMRRLGGLSKGHMITTPQTEHESPALCNAMPVRDGFRIPPKLYADEGALIYAEHTADCRTATGET